MARYFIDCEFDGHNGPLLSIAVVGAGDSIHICTTNDALDPWVKANVLPLMDSHQADTIALVHEYEVGRELRWFMRGDDSPVIVADSPVDIARFCKAISTGNNGGYHPCLSPKISFEVHNVDCYPTELPGAVQHNAWWDAMALRAKLESAA